MPTEEEIKAAADEKAAQEAAAKAAAEGDTKKLDQGPQPNFDPKELGKMVADGVQAGLQSFVAENPQDDQQNRRPEPTEVNPLQDLVTPLVTPGLQQAKLDSASAMDLSKFYLKNEEAKEYMDVIEKAFEDGIKQGTPTSRERLWLEYKGAHFDDFMKKRDEQNAEKLKKAKENEDLGGSPTGPGKKAIAVDYNTDPEEVNKALDGQEF